MLGRSSFHSSLAPSLLGHGLGSSFLRNRAFAFAFALASRSNARAFGLRRRSLAFALSLRLIRIFFIRRCNVQLGPKIAVHVQTIHIQGILQARREVADNGISKGIVEAHHVRVLARNFQSSQRLSKTKKHAARRAACGSPRKPGGRVALPAKSKATRLQGHCSQDDRLEDAVVQEAIVHRNPWSKNQLSTRRPIAWRDKGR